MLGLTHPPAIELAERLVAIAPPGLSRVFYSDNGSTAAEVALKMAFQYWRHQGETRPGFVCLRDGYHGDTIGSVSVGGIDLFHAKFGPLLFETWQAEPGDREHMDALLREHAGQVAAVIVEPLVQGAAGILTHPDGYLRAVRECCDEHGVLLICDEVATGFGRTGTMFACEQEGVAPDLMCVAKGLTGGYLPLAATLATERIYEAFLGEHAELRTFFHGHTYTGNPLACAAALATLEIFETRGHARRAGSRRSRCSASCSTSTSRRSIQCARCAAAASWSASSSSDFPLGARMGHQVTLAARRRGAIVRPLGDVVVLMAPLSITPRRAAAPRDDHGRSDRRGHRGGPAAGGVARCGRPNPETRAGLIGRLGRRAAQLPDPPTRPQEQHVDGRQAAAEHRPAPRLGDHAIVIGASIAGLFAARVLADSYDRVTILERDALPALGAHRRAVPQDRHAHALPARRPGRRRSSSSPPSSTTSVAAGALRFTPAPTCASRRPGTRSRACAAARASSTASRPRASRASSATASAALANVEIRERCGVVGLIGERGRVAGVRTRDVVRAQHRARRCAPTSSSPPRAAAGACRAGCGRWATTPPAEERVAVDIALRQPPLRLRPGALPGDKIIVDDARPDRPRGMFMIKEGDGERWTLTLEGYGDGDRPPTDEAGFAAFLASVADPDVRRGGRAGRAARRDRRRTRSPASLRRRYDRLARFPEGLLVMGDALCSFNPIYGQGMAVAALEALALQRCLRDGDRRLARRFFEAASVPVDHAWKLATAPTWRSRTSRGAPRCPTASSAATWSGCSRSAAHDVERRPRVRQLVVSLLTPPSTLLTPAIARRVLRRGARAPAAAPPRGRRCSPAPRRRRTPDAPARSAATHAALSLSARRARPSPTSP